MQRLSRALPRLTTRAPATLLLLRVAPIRLFSILPATDEKRPQAVSGLAPLGAAMNIGATPLLVASQNGHLEVVRELLARGAAVDAADNRGFTPLYIASREGHVEVVRELLARGAAADTTNSKGFTPLYTASELGHVEVVRELLAQGAAVGTATKKGWTPLLTASQEGHVEVVRELLARGAAADTKSAELAVQLAALEGHAAVVKLLRAANKK